MKPRHAGFNLIELMVTVAIVAIVAAVAVPSYRQYVIRAKRSEAAGALLRLAANQERFYIQNNTYASQALMDDPPPAGLGIDPTTERGLYDLTLAARGGGFANGYTATATVAAGGDQADDDECVTFTVNDQGLRTAADGVGTDNTDRCWR